MTKSPLALARTALATAKIALLPYSSKFSRRDYTRHQLFALLALRESLKTDYRGLEVILRDWAERRGAPGLRKVPDHSTLQKAARRLLEKRGVDALPGQTVAEARARGLIPAKPRAAIDTTGYETRHCSVENLRNFGPGGWGLEDETPATRESQEGSSTKHGRLKT